MEQKYASSSSKNSGQDTYAPAFYSLKITNSDAYPLLAQRLQQVFKAVYPQLVNRFARDPGSAASNPVRLILSADLPSPASTNDTMVRLNAHWMQEHPSQIGILTHVLASLVQAYPRGVPVWFADGMADYARSVYGPADDEWSSPDGVQPHQSYTQGGPIAARFLLWLQLHTRLDILDQIHYALQRGQSFSTVLFRLTHQTVDHLWSLYQAHPDITPTPQQRYSMATSTKPLFQSSWDIQCLSSGVFILDPISGLFISNFTMQADITVVKGDGGGFFFRDNIPHDPNSQYRLRVSSDGTYDLVDPPRGFAAGSSSAIKQGLNQTNHLTIIVQKHTMYVYING